jgi:hypothetical protein
MKFETLIRFGIFLLFYKYRKSPISVAIGFRARTTKLMIVTDSEKKQHPSLNFSIAIYSDYIEISDQLDTIVDIIVTLGRLNMTSSSCLKGFIT